MRIRYPPQKKISLAMKSIFSTIKIQSLELHGTESECSTRQPFFILQHWVKLWRIFKFYYSFLLTWSILSL